MTDEHRFELLNEEAWRDFLDAMLALRDKGLRLDVLVKQWRKKRSNEANRYYFGVVVRTLAQHTGYSEREMHDEILGAYVGWETREISGHKREFPRRRSTHPETMDSLDFSGLIMTGQRIAAELGVVLPDQMEKAV